jgi:diguanylate cyclase (GGDEF)-like protein
MLALGVAAAAMAMSSSTPALPPEVPLHQYQHQRWSVTEGLPQVSAQSLLQDDAGIVWVGTQNGLARFDGYEFRVFRSDDEAGLQHGYVNVLHQDDGGRIWIGTENGLSLFADGRLQLIDDGRSTGPIRAMATGPDPGTVWLATEGGLYLASDQGLTVHPDVRGALFGLVADPAGRVYVGGRGQLWVLDGESVEHHPLAEGRADLELRVLALDDNQLLSGSSDGLHRSPLGRPADWEASFLSGHEVEDLLIDRFGSLWIVTVSGLYRQRSGDRLPRAEESQYVSESEWLRSLLEDDEGNIWVGTQGRGILRLAASPFRRYTDRDGFIDGIVWSFHEDPQGTIWAGTNEHGVYRMRDGRFEQFKSPDELPHRMGMGFLVDDAGRFWIATRAGVAWYDFDTLEPITTPDDLPTAGTFGIVQSSDRRVWLATREGLYWWRDGQIERMGQQHGLTQSRTRDVIEDSQGRIWVGTDTGIFRGGVDGFEQVGADTPAATMAVSSLFELDGTVWAMLQGAIVRIVDDEVRAYPDGQGLRATVSSFMIQDENDDIWTTTHEGIQRIPLVQFDEFDRGERDRFEGDLYGYLTHPVVAQCNGGHGQAGLYQPRAGLLWCPSLNGALSLDLGEVAAGRPAPRPRMVAVRAAGRHHELGHVQQAALTLPAEARDLEIDFAALSYSWPGGVRYRFRLDGFDREWQEVGARRTAFYTNLPPGRYRFEVEARHEGGTPSPELATLELDLSPHFYETVWFKVAVGLALLLLAYLGWRYSVRQLRRRGRVLEEMVRERTRQLDDMNQRLREASLTDPLTGLKNRRFLSDQLPHDIAQVDRAYTRPGEHPNRDMCFLMVDLDHFKRINDTYGHGVGDQVLGQIAEILKSRIRESDYVIRWGGEEFLIVARYSEREQAGACARRIAQAVRSHRFVTDKGELEATCSIGLSTYPAVPTRPDALDWEAVVELADAANYLAKQEGRDRWVQIKLTEQAAEAGFMQACRERGVQAMAESGHLEIRREKD